MKKNSNKNFAQVILPFAVPINYTYEVPKEFQLFIEVGMRVEVPFGKNKLYAAIVSSFTENKEDLVTPKKIISLIDDQPIINEKQLEFWTWLADYYCCTLGEIMAAALPAALRLSSETTLEIHPDFEDKLFEDLSDKEYLITEALTIQKELTLTNVQDILNQKNTYRVIQSLLEKNILLIREEIQKTYKPKFVSCIRLTAEYLNYKKDETVLENAFKLIGNSEKQEALLLAYIVLNKEDKLVLKSDLLKKANTSSSILNSLIKKGIFEKFEIEISRIASYTDEILPASVLSKEQEKAVAEIEQSFDKHNVVLLHGVTGSGKTQVYIELIKKVIAEDKQVLYLLPEIALTNQMISRLEKYFGDDIQVYHSRLNANQRVELWKKVNQKAKVILGPRSAIFLPFSNLGLVIVDESHDGSFKQSDPAPRYNGRDAAIYYAHIFKAKTLLGTATPSIESLYQVKKGKYGIVTMNNRYGDVKMPKIEVVDKKQSGKLKELHSQYTRTLLTAIEETLKKGEQVIIFQNRRGYVPTVFCDKCNWSALCKNCDITLTYHKGRGNLQCHICGYHAVQPKSCPACGDPALFHKGLGTEKIEDELQVFFPEAGIGRLDFDTAKTRNAFNSVIHKFETRETQILIGTQMVTKGLDFENVGLVGVISAESLIYFPDFRASERTFQLLTQVSGRAGRRKTQGKVIIQSFDVEHEVFSEVINNDYARFYSREIEERQIFKFPPFYRLIKISIKHRQTDKLKQASDILGHVLKKNLGERVQGPAVPRISRVKNYYLTDYVIKLEKNPEYIASVKKLIKESIVYTLKHQGLYSTRIVVDVDPLF